MDGICGRILRVNLTTRTIEIETPPEEFYRTYFGGQGFVAHYLLNEVPAGADPLGPDNILVFATGVLTGAPFAGSGRHSVGGKSPLTGGFGESEAGGFWGAELKKAGFDALVIRGVASEPVYLWINGQDVQIQPARHLWGKETAEVQAAIRAELGDERVRIAQIGPAGEKLVRFACITHDLKHFAGRTGMGAVMGSKRLRAVAVRGHEAPSVADPEKVRELARWVADNHMTLARGLYDCGTAAGVPGLNAGGGLPTRNFRQGQFEGYEKISGQTMRDTILIGRESCYACPIHCKRVVKVEEGPYRVDPMYGGPEYETIAALGSNCGIDDLAAVAYGNQRCGALGLDTISTGLAIAFAMDCAENGILTPDRTGLPDLGFGNAGAMLTLIEKIATRDGIGDFLAEGVRRAAQALGPAAAPFAVEVKGQEVPMHEPRLKQGLGIGYAVSPTGADHCHNVHDTAFVKMAGPLEDLKSLGILNPMPASSLGPEKVRLVAYYMMLRTFNNCAVNCWFVPWTITQTAELVRAVTGWNSTAWELMKVGERALTLARCFNIREGIGAAEDRLPGRIHEPFADGRLAGVGVDREAFAAAVRLYYAMLGWDEETGVPAPGKLAELGIEWAAGAMGAGAARVRA